LPNKFWVDRVWREARGLGECIKSKVYAIFEGSPDRFLREIREGAWEGPSSEGGRRERVCTHLKEGVELIPLPVRGRVRQKGLKPMRIGKWQQRQRASSKGGSYL